MLAPQAPSKPIWKSKIVWTAIGSVVVYVFTDIANMDPATKAAWLTVFGFVQNAAIGAMRIWWTNTELK